MLVGAHAERDLTQMQRVWIVIRRRLAVMREESRSPQRLEIAELVGRRRRHDRLEAQRDKGGREREQNGEDDAQPPAAQLHVEGANGGGGSAKQ